MSSSSFHSRYSSASARERGCLRANCRGLAPRLASARPRTRRLRLGSAWAVLYLHRRGIEHLFHDPDDFIIVGPAGSPQCAQVLAILDDSCAALGVPVAEHKREGPTTCLTFLGIEMDTQAAQLRLPADKRLWLLLEDWSDRKVCSWCELESLRFSITPVRWFGQVGLSYAWW